DIYDYQKDMALVLVTVVATFLAGIYQRRQSFIAALKEEWRDIVKAKSALIDYTHLAAPDHRQYLAAFKVMSETLDNMRCVYANVGESSERIGYYPFEPLHDMRRVLQALDPRHADASRPLDRSLARDAVIQSFLALRERFLEELDLEAPDNPILTIASTRTKTDGAHERQRLVPAAGPQEPASASPATRLLLQLKQAETMRLARQRSAEMQPDERLLT
ncbi:MAG: hypothetical protein AB7O57_15495, partial [Hyphomicrobiaceae bacterium]